MVFDAIIIGGGLAGLTCGIKLSQQNKKCLVISSGQSALHFSSGSFDLLNALDGHYIENPVQTLDQLIQENAQHPYAKIGKENFIKYTAQAKQQLIDADIPVIGDAHKNHYRITSMGSLKPTWLSVKDFAVSDSLDVLPWKKVSIFNITGFLDFHPNFIADELKTKGVASETYFIDLPELENLRRNPSELRATNISRVFDNKESLNSLAEIIKKGINDSEAIIFPACIGLQSNTVEELSEMVGKPIYLIPTFPPSIAGIRSQQSLKRYFEKLGGVYMLGDMVMKITIDADKVTQVYTYNHSDIPFVGKNTVLATGDFFSKGLIASRTKVFEPIANLDVDFEPNRQDWYANNFFDDQNYQRFGVKTNKDFKVYKNGSLIDNMYAIGAVLSQFNAMEEGCGAGVSLLTALHVADEIIKK